MADRKSSIQSRKRLAKALQDDYWDCSVCTFRNSRDDFKCSVCDVRKGTSTRKPRLNQQIVDQQEATRLVTIANMPVMSSTPNLSPSSAKVIDETERATQSTGLLKPQNVKKGRCHIQRGIDRSSTSEYNITVNDRTIVFTEFKPKS